MTDQKQEYNVIGLMSGTSLDGVDIAHCAFSLSKKNEWEFQINSAKTISYPKALKTILNNATSLSGLELSQLNVELGKFFGKATSKFINDNKLPVDFIASHGHTVFHQPEKQLTVQIGSGSSIASRCNLPVICDFRSTDVAYIGQGAPLVPIGDELLFDKYDACINLGGFANISFKRKGKRIAFDICPLNIITNDLCQKINLAFDDGGQIAKSGHLISSLVEDLNSINFYTSLPPKSLGKEWVIETIEPILLKHEDHSIPDLLHTFIEHYAIQISNVLNNNKIQNSLFTGGGTFNDYLITRIKQYTSAEVVIPKKEIIDFKEALIFAFLGVLRWRNTANCLASVTGALKDNIGGAIYLP